MSICQTIRNFKEINKLYCGDKFKNLATMSTLNRLFLTYNKKKKVKKVKKNFWKRNKYG